MRLFKTIALVSLFLGCSIRNDIEPLHDYANPVIENGLQVTIGRPEKFNEAIDFLPISFTNLANDTLHLGKFFLISTEFPDNHSFELFIFSQDVVHYKLKDLIRIYCFAPIPIPQPFDLPPGKSYDKVLSLSLEFEYGLEIDKVYDAYLVYRSSNPENHNKDQNNTQQEWHGSIKSNAVRFKYKPVLRLDLLEGLLQAVFDE